MSGWSTAQSRIKHLCKKSKAVELGNQVSVVYFDMVDGKQVIDWPPNPAAGVLCVPRQVSLSEWSQKNS